VRNLLNALSSLELPQRVTVLCLEDTQRDFVGLPGVEFIGLRTRPRLFAKLRFSARLFLKLFRHRPRQIILTHPNLSLVVGAFCWLLGLRFRCMVYYSEVSRPWTGIRRWGLLRADKLLTLSDSMSKRLADIQALPASQFEALPCCVNTDVFCPGPAPETFGSKHKPILLTVARLDARDAYKGIDTVLYALPLILQKYPDALYLVIGSGNREIALKGLADRLGVRPNTRFLGSVSSEALPEYYRLADCFVLPSWEGFGIVYLEALASGTPVVSGDSDGSDAPLQGAKLGWRVPRTNPTAVAKACLEALAGKDPRCNSAMLRNETKAKFSVEAFQADVERLVRSPINQRE
jgi:phosphatidyl-myo-inositol dimannoside synthase